jgi:hypothetical protein
MAILAITSFAALLAAGMLIEVATARTGALASPRRWLNHLFSLLWTYPAKAVRWHQRRREESYHASEPEGRSTLTKWAIRCHVLILIPAAAWFAAEALEAFAADHKPIAGLYFSPDQAWYLGAASGGIFAAMAPLVAYIALWMFVVLPYIAVSFAAGMIGRLLINATDGASGREQAPFAILGGLLGLAAAGGLPLLAG